MFPFLGAYTYTVRKCYAVTWLYQHFEKKKHFFFSGILLPRFLIIYFNKVTGQNYWKVANW